MATAANEIQAQANISRDGLVGQPVLCAAPLPHAYPGGPQAPEGCEDDCRGAVSRAYLKQAQRSDDDACQVGGPELALVQHLVETGIAVRKSATPRQRGGARAILAFQGFVEADMKRPAQCPRWRPRYRVLTKPNSVW